MRRNPFLENIQKHFGKVEAAPPRRVVTEDPDGNPLEIVQCRNCSTQYWADGETPCPRCDSMDADVIDVDNVKSKSRFDGSSIPSFEDFVASGGRIVYEPPPPIREDEDKPRPCEDCEQCGDCDKSILCPSCGAQYWADSATACPHCAPDISDIAKRLDVSCLSTFDADALRPEAPATQDDVSQLAKALSKEVKRIEAAFNRIAEKKGSKK
jgi:hypothetical protein